MLFEAEPGTYARIERHWKPGDVVSLDMPMDIKRLEGHPRIEEVRNQVAIKRGPVVYCERSVWVWCVTCTASSDSGTAEFKIPAVWDYSAPLIAPEKRQHAPSRAQKDPTVVFHDGLHHGA